MLWTIERHFKISSKRAWIHCIQFSANIELQLTTHQWIQGFLVKTFCWFFRDVFELQISPIPIFASSFQGLSDGQVKFSLWPTQQLTFDKTWYWAIYLTDNKTFLLLRNLNFFSTKDVHLGACFQTSKDILELVQKMAIRA